VTIDNLSGEVLLEIFDHYRQSSGSGRFHMKIWNNKNGWFKLAHVCHKWRCIVFASSRRLELALFFAESTPTRAAVLESQSLSRLPIFVDYTDIVWNAGAQTRLISALRYSNRVYKIAINGSHKNFDKICNALDLPLPGLRSLELHNIPYSVDVKPILLASSFMTSIKSLLHLRLANVRLSSLLPLLSVTRELVFLRLTVDTLLSQTGGASLLTHLQRIPHLRLIQISSRTDHSNYMPKPPITTALLAKLSNFKFSGQCTELEWLVTGLVTPSLRALHVQVSVFESHHHTLQFPQLSKFIHAARIFFCAARLSLLAEVVGRPSLTTTMFAHPYSINGEARTVTLRTRSGDGYLGSALSPMLATIVDVFLWISIPLIFPRPPLFNLVQWREFLKEFRNVKVLRMHHGLETEIANMLRQPTPTQEEVHPDAPTASGPTMNSSGPGSIFTLDIFPLLEKIVLYARTSDSPIGEVREDELVAGAAPFGEYVIARQRMGRPVQVLWDRNPDLPWPYKLPDLPDFGA
jgi:hypothetical protein